MLDVLQRVPTRVLAHRVRAVLQVDVAKELAQCTVPLLYLRACHDCIVSHSTSKKLQAIRPSLKVVDIEAPHLLLQTAPETASKAVVAKK